MKRFSVHSAQDTHETHNTKCTGVYTSLSLAVPLSRQNPVPCAHPSSDKTHANQTEGAVCCPACFWRTGTVCPTAAELLLAASHQQSHRQPEMQGMSSCRQQQRQQQQQTEQQQTPKTQPQQFWACLEHAMMDTP
jgi:hypothetical protein